jgi:hypothetical protein
VEDTFMTTRSSSREVTFAGSFFLTGFDMPQAPGTYTINTEEEQIDSATFIAWRKMKTSIQIKQDGSIEHVGIDDAELTEALLRDAAKSGGQPYTRPSALKRRTSLFRGDRRLST